MYFESDIEDKILKTYKHIYEKFISDDNIRQSIKLAKCNKSKKKKQKFDKRITEFGGEENYIRHIKNYAENFHNADHKPIEIYDGISRKKRTILVPTIDEQVVHHMIVNAIKPLFMKGMYYHSNAAIPERGCTRGMKYMKKWIKKGGSNIKYCFKMDIKKFFDSIPHTV